VIPKFLHLVLKIFAAILYHRFFTGNTFTQKIFKKLQNLHGLPRGGEIANIGGGGD